MTIQQSPAQLSLLGNMLHLVVSSNADVTMILSLGNEQLAAHTYSPDSTGMIDVDLCDIVGAHLSFLLRESQVPYIQNGIIRHFSGTLTCGGQTEQFGFTVIRTGVDNLADTPANFLSQNFLTWQPTVKPVTYYTPEFLTYYAAQPCTVKCTAYTYSGNGTSLEIGSLTAGNCYTIPTGYAVIAALADFLPSYYDVWIENQGGTRLTYVQRYYASDIRSEEEEWILFENSLGGIDTFRAYGDSENTASHEHHVAEIEEESVEYRVDTERKHKKSTGLLDKHERRWLLDFFPSKGKYIYAGQSIRRIVVTDSDVSYNAKELPSEYNFTYKFAEAKPYLNLPRTDVTLQEMHIDVPDIGSFTIAPRLVEFPRQTLGEGALFPIQNPYSETWGVTTLGAIAEYLKDNLAFTAHIVQTTEVMLDEYLPLCAGIDNPLTGDLYARGIMPVSANSYALGSQASFWKDLFIKRIYFRKPNANNDENAIYLEYDLANDGVHLVGAGLYSDSYVSALGAGSGGSGGSGSVSLNQPLAGINTAGLGAPTATGQALVWNGTTWVYSDTYLTSASLNGYATESWVNSRLTGYLPLTGGNITGGLNVANNVGIGTTSPSYKLHVVGYTFTTRLYLANGVYLEYDLANEGVHLVGAGLYSDSYLSALGAGSGGSGGSGSVSLNQPLAGINTAGLGAPTATGQALVWNGTTWVYSSSTSLSVGTLTVGGVLTAGSFAKSGGTSAQFLKADGSVDANTYLTPASLSGYATETWVNNKGYATETWVNNNGYATESWVNSRLTGYLPLTGGNITGGLNVANNVGIGTTSPSYKLHVVGYTFTTRLYLANGVYLEYDLANEGVHLVGAGFYSDSYVSALGPGSGGGSSPTLNQPLSGINSASMGAPTTSGQSLVWNGSTWVYSDSVNVKVGSLSVSSTISAAGQISGATVSASGFYVNGYDDTYVLQAGGGKSKLKTINGYSIFGTGNIDAAGGIAGNYLPLDGGIMAGAISFTSGDNVVTYNGEIVTYNGETVTYGSGLSGSIYSGSSDVLAPTFSSVASMVIKSAWGISFVNESNTVAAIMDVANGMFAVRNKVGIGTDSPSYTLHVSGTLYASGTATVGGVLTAGGFVKSGGTSAQFLKADGSVDANTYLTSASLSGYATETWVNNKGYATESWVNTALSGYLPLTGGDITGSLTVANNVGIGTTSPSYKLHVVGYTFTTRLYLANGVYLEYDLANEGVHLVGAGLYSDSYVSALGPGSGGGSSLTLNQPLSGINSAAMGSPTSAGQTVVWNGSSWVYSSTTGLNVSMLTSGGASFGGNVSVSGTLNATGSFVSASGRMALGYTTVSSSYRIRVSGDAYFDDKLCLYGGSQIYGGTGSNNTSILNISASFVFMNGSSIHTSDMNLKTIKGYIDNVTIDQIALSPIFDYMWKTLPDYHVHSGTSAQYWQGILPHCVEKNPEGNLGLDYEVVALVSAVITARRVVDHERRIRELERENEILKEKINDLIAA